MARPTRVHFPGAVYHVIARGNNRESVFLSDADKSYYLKLLARYKLKYPYSLYAYILMDNHLHLLLAVKEQPLARIMQGIQQSYTQYFNKVHARVGHVFQQRYKALLCRSDSYLLTLLRYIHLNPVRAGLSAGVDYPWSSHRYYLAGTGDFVDFDYILKILSVDKKNALIQYAQILNSGGISMDDLESAYIDAGDVPTASTTRKIDKHIKIDEIVHAVAQVTNIEASRVLAEKGTHEVVRARNLLIYSVLANQIMTKTELAQFLEISLPRIIKGYNWVTDNVPFREKAAMVKQIIEKV